MNNEKVCALYFYVCTDFFDYDEMKLIFNEKRFPVQPFAGG